MVQLHKRFTDNQVKEFIERYLKEEIERDYIQEVPGIGKTRFFALIYAYLAGVLQAPATFNEHQEDGEDIFGGLIPSTTIGLR